MPCVVVNVKKAELRKRGIADLLEWSSRPDAVYIGRAMRYVPGAETASRWANPFSVERYGRARCLALYEARVRADTGAGGLWDALGELRGKELGCWCAPERCHGDVLRELISSLGGAGGASGTSPADPEQKPHQKCGEALGSLSALERARP